MRTSLALAALLSLACAAAQALTVDAKALARFDVSYTKCEASHPQMKGHRDEAYLALWRVKADDKARAELAAARKRADYQAERRHALQPPAKGASSTDARRLEQQCQGLWAETQRTTKTTP